MNGPRTARTVLVALVALLAGLVMPFSGVARPLVAAAAPAMRDASADLWAHEDLNQATVAPRVGDSEHGGAHLPIAGVVPSTADERVVLVSMVLVLLASTLVRGRNQPAGARAPPFLRSVT